MQKRSLIIVAVLLALIVFVAIFTFSRFSIKNSDDVSKGPQTADGKSQEDSSEEIEEIVFTGTSNTKDSDVIQTSGGGGDGGGEGESDSAPPDSDSPPAEQYIPPYHGNYCGVSSEIPFQIQLNLSSDLDEAQKIVFDCMSDALSTCSPAKIILVSISDNPNSQYEIKGMQDNSCIVSGPDESYSVKECKFSQNAIDTLFSTASQNYPGLKAAKSYEVLRVVNSGGNANVTCS